MNKQNILINSIGFIFLLFGITAIIDRISKFETGLAPILWMSYICLIIIGIGILKKDSSLIASQLCIIGIPYLFWNIDFFYHLITNSRLLGITDYFFVPGPIIGKIISSQHIFNLPLSILVICLIGLKRKDFWIISLIQVTIVFFISRIATNYSENVNCVYHNCANFNFSLWYPLEWFLSYAIMIGLTSLILIKYSKKRKKKK